MCFLCVWGPWHSSKPENSSTKVPGLGEWTTDQILEVKICVTVYIICYKYIFLPTNRGKRVRVFLNGDYEFLCHMFWLSGASGMSQIWNKIVPCVWDYYCITTYTGKHPCLWCLTKSDSLRDPTNPLVLKTTASICADYDSFVADGADLKKAKLYNNVVREPFFKELPIEQVQGI